MEEFSDKYAEELPASWDKQYKSLKLKRLIQDNAMWIERPLPKSKEGRKILKLNDPLFRYCETLEDFDYALEPVNMQLIELVPASVKRQGVGISVDVFGMMLEIDLYLFPCDYTEDEKRNLPYHYLRVPVVSVGNTSLVNSFVKKHFPGTDKSVVIPFSLERTAELKGYFMDDIKTTEIICRKAVAGGTTQEKKNCEDFLEFVRTAGFE